MEKPLPLHGGPPFLTDPRKKSNANDNKLERAQQHQFEKAQHFAFDKTKEIQQDSMNSNSHLIGAVHGRDFEGSSADNSSPEAQRRRLMRHDEAAVEAYEHPHVLCFAARNHRGRFYIPCKINSFGGVPIENVLFDSGCSSLLLPFPLENGFPPELMTPAICQWIVSSSRGTGAVHSPVLKIKRRMGKFPCTLADKEQPRLEMLRFHLGCQACNKLLSDPNCRNMLDEGCINKLNDFLRQIDGRESPERTYALLGQSYMAHVFYCQQGDVALALSDSYDGNENITLIMGRYHQKLVPLVQAFEGFHDLEDDDGDEDEEDYRLSWDPSSSDEVDEPDDR